MEEITIQPAAKLTPKLRGEVFGNKDLLSVLLPFLDNRSLELIVEIFRKHGRLQEGMKIVPAASKALVERAVKRLCHYPRFVKVIKCRLTPKLLKALRQYHTIRGMANEKKTCIYADQESYDDLLEQLPEEALDAFITWQTASQPFIEAARDGDLEKVTAGLKKGNVWVNGCDNQGRTALHFAVGTERWDVVKLLLAKGDINVNVQDEDGKTALHLAAVGWGRGWGVLELLLAKGDIDVNAQDKNGWTALHWAAYRGSRALVELLLHQDGIDVNGRDNWGLTALHFAVGTERWDVVELLLAKGDINVNVQDEDEKTALHLAVAGWSRDLVGMLLATRGIDVNAQDGGGKTAFHLASRQRCLDVVKLLLAKGDINVNAQDEDGRTAFHLALWLEHPDVVNLFFERDDIKINLKDTCGRTVRSLALHQGKYQIASILFWQEWRRTFGMVAAVVATSFACWRLFKWIRPITQIATSPSPMTGSF